MSLSLIALVLGVGCLIAHLVALARPAAAMAWLRGFPRNVPVGVALMLIGTVWFEWNLNNENLDDIAKFKTAMQAAFAVLGVASCFYVKDFLAVRGLCVVMLMAAWLVCDTARWHPSLWRDAISGWAYVWALAGLWWSVQPWRARDAIQWVVATPGRFRTAALAGIFWGLFVIGLSQTALR
jgi:hypothetical protein